MRKPLCGRIGIRFRKRKRKAALPIYSVLIGLDKLKSARDNGGNCIFWETSP